MVTSSGDDADALRGELAHMRRRAEDVERRLDEVLFVVTSMTARDYSRRVELRDDDDFVVSALAIGLNMMCEELQRWTEELTTARDRALVASHAKSRFLATMSH
ncbi:MAG: hypothetical protein KC468_03655, partial [Myxococcales bacterium]|nr:hypothetical protein [Myxococcales bacterium]